jgi:hypothetical protein
MGDPERFTSHSTVSGASGTITEFNAPGGKVKGSFDVIALIVESSPQTAHLTGNFSVTRY